MEARKMLHKLPGSFRDPNGFVFRSNGILYRQVNIPYKPQYKRLMQSGLYTKLTELGFLISHTEVTSPSMKPVDKDAFCYIRPVEIPFVSYPYEWSFSQLKDAALLTLSITKIALEHGMILKDASAYNVQFAGSVPVFIDTLSFEIYDGRPWVAYRQFCQHFLAPLAIAAYRDVRLIRFLSTSVDGIPLDLAKTLLPARSRLNFPLFLHLHAHAGSMSTGETRNIAARSAKISKMGLMGILDSLETAIRSLNLKMKPTVWADYYDHTNYSAEAMAAKSATVAKWTAKLKPKTVWDIGANTGVFSHIAAKQGAYTVALDDDPLAIEMLYKDARTSKLNILPLWCSITSPSAGIGWENSERASLLSRGPVDMVYALALLHHLVITGGIPLDRVAHLFGSLCRYLIIEFVPKIDSQCQKLLILREDIFSGYTERNFEQVFGGVFRIREKQQLGDSLRHLYLMEKK